MRATVPLIAALIVTIASAAGAATDHFLKVATFPGNGEGSIPPQTSFPPDMPKITFGVQMHDVEPGDQITATWIAEKTDAAPDNYKIDSTTMTVGEDTKAVLAFRMTKPTAGWPGGTYRIDLSYNNDIELSEHFSVEAK